VAVSFDQVGTGQRIVERRWRCPIDPALDAGRMQSHHLSRQDTSNMLEMTARIVVAHSADTGGKGEPVRREAVQKRPQSGGH
jgi:hypothetical protein